MRTGDQFLYLVAVNLEETVSPESEAGAHARRTRADALAELRRAWAAALPPGDPRRLEGRRGR